MKPVVTAFMVLSAGLRAADCPLSLSDPATVLALDWDRLVKGSTTVSVYNKSGTKVAVTSASITL